MAASASAEITGPTNGTCLMPSEIAFPTESRVPVEALAASLRLSWLLKNPLILAE